MEEREEYQIDLKQVAKIILKKSPIIAAIALIFAAVAYIASNYFITPMYSTNIKLYINNQQGVSESAKVQQGDMNTSITLVDSYIAMIKTDMVLDEVAVNSGIGYTAAQIGSMISAEKAGDQAPMMMVTVRSSVPEYAQTIANAVADIAPALIQGKVKGSNAEVIDRAKLPTVPYSPNVKKNTLLGLLLGIAAGAVLVLLAEALDVRIKSCDYLTKKYEVPILGVIPKIAGTEEKR